MLTLLLPLAAAFAIGAVLTAVVERRNRRADRAAFEKSGSALTTQLTDVGDRLEQARGTIAQQQATIARLEERATAAQSAMEQMRTSLPETFTLLAGKILQDKSDQFAKQNQSSLGQVLDPLKSRLKDFEDALHSVHLQQVAGGATLQAQVERLVESNRKITEEANHLATALKGSSKTQGNWGELILETILQASGLRPGHEYEAQESYATENGRRAQPDVVVRLAGGRNLVVDAKVSLLAYEAHCSAEQEAAKLAALHEHLGSVRAHIKGLAEKNYQSLYGLKSLDFVIMFIPIEPAFLLAVSGDSALWEDAWRRNVLLVSPSTLLFVLRTVAYLWRQDQQTRNVEEIAKRGAELYNKLAGLVDDLQEVGERLTQAQRSYESAFSKLSTGKGNVIRQAEMLKALGVKPGKHLPRGLVEQAQQEELDLLDQPSEPLT